MSRAREPRRHDLGARIRGAAGIALCGLAVGCEGTVVVGAAPNPFRCREAAWTAGIACARIHSVASQEELSAALSAAAAGDCIEVAAGSYAGAELPSGVHLLGRGADCVALSGDVRAGEGSVIRGVTIEEGGILAAGVAVVHSTRIVDSPDSGVRSEPGASVHVIESAIEHGARYGIFAEGDVTLERSAVRDNGGPGLWVDCHPDEAGCSCLGAPRASIVDSELTGNLLVNAYFEGVNVELTGAVVRNAGVMEFEHGHGLGFSCSTVVGAEVVTESNAGAGLLITDSDVELEGVTVANNLRGVWIAGDGEHHTAIAGARIGGNDAVGVHVAEGNRLRLRRAVIRDTNMVAIPVVSGGASAGAAEVGDGVSWCKGARVELDELTLASNARASILIDERVGSPSHIRRLTLAEGDEALGIVMQNTYPGATLPTVGEGVPAIELISDSRFSMPCSASP